MKHLNRFLGFFSLILFILLIISLIILTTYTSINHDNLNNLIKWDFDNFFINFKDDEKRENFYDNTLTIKDSKEFSVKDNIVINATFEDILFVKEDRDNILVEYYVKKPKSNLYKIDYTIDEFDNTIYFESLYSVQNISSNFSENGYIKFYVPNDYVCESLDITMSIGDINNHNILDSVNNLYISANLGDVDFIINTPKNDLLVNCDLGNVNLTTNAQIENLDISCNFGDLNLITNKNVNSLYVTADMGEIEINAFDLINYVNLEANIGNINASFYKYINNLVTNADVGNIVFNFYENNDSSVFIDSNIGDVYSDFVIVNNSSEADFKFYTNMGSINLYQK